MRFKLILNEQTPAPPALIAAEQWIPEHRELLESFVEYAENRGDAVGLAANQLSLDGERIMHRFFAMMTEEGWRLVVDPHVMERRGIVQKRYEGCLTWPGKKIVAERHLEITASYYTIDGEYVTAEDFVGFDAQVFQHEYDHLEGVREEMVDNDFRTYRRENPKIGRNDPCPCNSGKKYKKCCGRRGE